jgi:hypothetical protein
MGKVSAQYLAICDQHGVDYHPVRPKLGHVLDVTPEYFDRAYSCIFEIGVKLAHVLWRKILPGERRGADSNLIGLIYDLLEEKKYDLAIFLGQFSVLTLKEHFDDDLRRRMVINLAQAYKWKNARDRMEEIIAGEDWSSCSQEFKLAIAVLRDQFLEAAKIMKLIGRTGEVREGDYRKWPLFEAFRKSQEFVDAHQEIFGHAMLPEITYDADSYFAVGAHNSSTNNGKDC